ncbi:hypothetical protein M758_5G047700 [Ceratodon purpureus]|nr:hypothetical protein M758_5G047700 [Ceratodon purpureus]
MAVQHHEPYWRPPRKRPRGQCSSSATATDDYDVFLNHRGPDVKGGFIAHLHDALQSAGLNPFLDKKSLFKGNHAFEAIDAALKVARVHVAVVSMGYAESKHCLSELAAMMSSGKPVIPVFYDVEPADLRRVEMGPFAAAFEKHKSREPAEQVQEWADALHKVADITGFCLSEYNGDEAELKRDVVEDVQSLMPTNEAVVRLDHHFVGLDEPMKRCVDKMEKISSDVTGLLFLVGMGGIGKTTLAKEIYNHFVAHKNFQAMSFLEIGHQSPSDMQVGSSLLSKLQRQLLWDLLHISDNNQYSYKYWFDKISRRGPVLIVLDDLYDEVHYDMLILNSRLLAPGSCIIVTSRDRHLLKLIAKGSSGYCFHEVTPLGCEDSQKLFNWHAFGNEETLENFEVVASDVCKACGGLPLALKVVGSSLFDKTSNEDRKDLWPEAVKALKGNANVMRALKWSYDCLTTSEKLMFVDIACLFYGWSKKAALDIWKSCEECSCDSCCGCEAPHISLDKLVDKSLVVLEEHPTSVSQDKILVMHNLLRDMGQNLAKDEGNHLWGDRASKAMKNNNQKSNKVRSLNLANIQKQKYNAENFAKMPNLHFLILDGCDISGNFGVISKELRWLQWKYMPLKNLPPLLDLSNLTSLDFSQSIELADMWAESNPALEACPNLLKLNLSDCTSLTTLPDSIGSLSRLQVLELFRCGNLQRLPSSIGQLTALQKLLLERCRRLEALPDSITELSGLQLLDINFCSSISKLPETFGLMTGLTSLYIDLATEWQAIEVGQLHKLKELGVTECTDEIITVLDNSAALGNLEQLSEIWFYECPFITKLPETIVLLSSLWHLDLWRCEKLQELDSNSIRQLKSLKRLSVRYCSSVKALPECLGELTSLEELWIVRCTSVTELPMSIGNLSRLWRLHIQGCSALQSFPNSLRQLNALQSLQV